MLEFTLPTLEAGMMQRPNLFCCPETPIHEERWLSAPARGILHPSLFPHHQPQPLANPKTTPFRPSHSPHAKAATNTLPPSPLRCQSPRIRINRIPRRKLLKVPNSHSPTHITSKILPSVPICFFKTLQKKPPTQPP